MWAPTIDDIIHELDQIIDQSMQNNNRSGYFPALYRKVTIKVKEGIANSTFEDGPRMERLDVIFANRYLQAYNQHSQKELTTQSWEVTFLAANSYWPIVLQHLLMGMNAHINLDLGIAAAQTSPGREIDGLQNDFNTINTILASLVDQVENELAEVWPVLGFLDRAIGRTDEAVINFSMTKARDAAWNVAKRLAPLDESAQESEIKLIDESVAKIGRLVYKPGFLISSVTKIIRLGERSSVKDIIQILQ